MKNQNCKPLKQTLCCCLIVLVCTFTFGQRTVVSGTVFDKESGEPIPYANIAFKHSSVGAITDFKGYFYIDTKYATDTLLASYVGYTPDYVSINVNSTQEVEIRLSSNVHALDEIVVTPGENPAFYYLDKIKERKKFNNPERFSSMSYKTYNKLRLDLNNINDELTQRRVLRKFQFVIENMDSSEVFGKTYLPVLITESVSNFYHQKKPKVEREVIEAYKMSGIENTSFAQFTGKMYQKLNIYDDFMTYIEPGFVSPIADFGKLYYKYYLEDSAYFDDSWCYKISFKPKRKRERVFYGYFWVADTSWALKKVQLRVASDVNINFVNDMMAITEFQKVNDSLWFIKNEEILIDFNLGEETYGFFGRKYASYSDIEVNTELPREITEIKTDTYVLEDELKRNDEYWEENRTLELSDDDANVYEMVDSVKKVPLFNTVFTIADMIYSYYLDAGPIEIGPYYTFYSHNPIEGHRFKFGARTSSEFSETYRFGGHLAYGTLDKKLKYGMSIEYLLAKNPRKRVGFFYNHDMKQLGKYDNALRDDSFLSTVLQRSPNYKLTMVDEYKLEYEHEWFQGMSNQLDVKYQKMFSTDYVPLIKSVNENESNDFNSLVSTEITLKTHFAHKEKFLLGKFDRTSVGTKSPMFDLWLTYGVPGVLGSEYEYFKVKASMTDNIEINPFGYTHMVLTAGKVFGKLPYPLLELHQGNETYAGYRHAFNMMNYYEFVSDEFISAVAEHHFQGFFLKRIPLISYLELREVVGAKILMGRTTYHHQDIMDFPEGLQSLTKPYSEVSVGVENILKLFRVDAVWRLSYLDKPNVDKFGLRLGIYLAF